MIACGLFRRGGDRDADAEELKAASRTRSRSVVVACRFRGEHRARDDGMRSSAPVAARRAARSIPTATTGSPCLARSPASPAKGVTVDGMDAAAVSYPTFQQDLAAFRAGRPVARCVWSANTADQTHPHRADSPGICPSVGFAAGGVSPTQSSIICHFS